MAGFVARLTAEARASAQGLAGLELSRKSNRLRALPLSPHRDAVSCCAKFRLRKRTISADSTASLQSRMASHPTLHAYPVSDAVLQLIQEQKHL